ncbi:squalene--hopene cyclase [Methylohalobius crimeensis]|uniref:squalene--hopene cyclase n=1 Tax=Methylohalobius crimeensis TaxID=244365 RepID=UPI0013782FAC|nr:squalene--hopene cyclase [Methylohalobius crimeensis]
MENKRTRMHQSGTAARSSAVSRAAAHVGAETELDRALAEATDALLALQHEEGWWNGEVEANQTLDAQYIFLLHYTGLLERPEYQDKARRLANWIRRMQRPDGTWAIHYDAPGCISVTTESYTALKLLGDPADAPHMAKARKFIRAHGGPTRTRVLTRYQLALLGELDWVACPSLPVQLMFVPRVSRFNIYELSYWSRVCTVPLAVLTDYKKVVPVSEGRGISELYPAPVDPDVLYEGAEDIRGVSRAHFFVKADKVLKWCERRGINPLRERALARAKRWILDHQDDSGDWGGIFPAIANSLLALYVMGMDVDADPFLRGMQALERFEWPDEVRDETHVAPCVSPVWDTAWSVLALVEAGVRPDTDPVARACDWLTSMQIQREGDWAVKAKDVPAGGWAFQFYNDFYPDTDDSAVVMMALTNGSPESEGARRAALDLARRWLLGLQNGDGGWGAFELEVNDERFNEILYNDEKNMLDPSTVDVTGRILEMLGVLGASRSDPVVQRAEAYVRREQEPDGSWWGRWGVNYVYGTWSVVRGLAALGVGPDDPAMRAAGDWLERYQQDDGGFGESCASYLPGHEGETCAPTAAQTAWGLMGLISCGRAAGDPVRRAADWLIRNQEEDGLWCENEFTGTGFPNAFYLKYHHYPKYFPVLALAVYRNAKAKRAFTRAAAHRRLHDAKTADGSR